MVDESKALDLNYPNEDWRGFFKRHFGPLIVWALVGIGSSHMILGPTLGGTYGLVAVWLVTIIYAVKYGCWELGIRYNYAIGESFIDAYSELPGPRNWAVWLSLLAISSAAIVNTAAVGISTATFAVLAVDLSVVQMYVLLIVFSTALVLFSRYTWLERFLMLFVVVLTVLMVLSMLMGPPSEAVASETIFYVPPLTDAAFVALFAAAAGLMPTGLTSSIYLGNWSMAKNEGARRLRQSGVDPNRDEYHDYIRGWLTVGLRDFRIGYLFSYFLMIVLIVLSTNVLYPNPPTDEDLVVTLGQILGGTFGDWSAYIVYAGAFAALWSTVITVLDGMARALVDILNTLMGWSLPMERWRRVFVFVIAVTSSIPVLVVGDRPVTLVIILGTVNIILEFFIYPANLRVVLDHVPEAFRPSGVTVVVHVCMILVLLWFAVLGVAESIGLLG